MNDHVKSIRAFIGAKNYEESRNFYKALEFEERIVSKDMVYFKINDQLGFYLQDYYIKKWVNNSMLFMEVDDLDKYWNDLNKKELHHKYKYVRLSKIKQWDWGRECFLHDPSGVLWHFATFERC